MKLMSDPGDMHAKATTLNDLSGEYTSIYNRMLNAANTMGDAWKAADNLAFVSQINGLCDDLKNMATHLENASQALNRQAVNYETTQEANISGVRQLAN